jgi:hypothetical protein
MQDRVETRYVIIPLSKPFSVPAGLLLEEVFDIAGTVSDAYHLGSIWQRAIKD